MRKMIAVLLAGVMVLSLGACGSKDAGAVETAGSEEAVGQSAAAEGTEAAGDGEVVEITVQSWQYASGNYKGFTEDSELTPVSYTHLTLPTT